MRTVRAVLIPLPLHPGTLSVHLQGKIAGEGLIRDPATALRAWAFGIWRLSDGYASESGEARAAHGFTLEYGPYDVRTMIPDAHPTT
jgi:hypothetical protein